MFRLPDMFPKGTTDDWAYNGTVANFMEDINKIMNNANFKVKLYAPAPSKTIRNHIAYAVFMMLTAENPLNEGLPLEIHYVNETLYSPTDYNDKSAPIYMSPDEIPLRNTLVIRKVNEGTTYIDTNKHENELKGISMGLQWSKTHKVRFFELNKHRYDVFTNSYGWEMYHKLLALLPSLFPTSFPNVSDELKAVLVAVGNGDLEEFNRRFTEWVTVTKIEDKIELAQFKDWLTTKDRKDKQAAERTLKDYENAIEKSLNDLRAYYVEHEKAVKNLFGINQRDTSKAEEKALDILTYLRTNRSLKHFRVDTNNNKMYYTVEAPIKYVDPAAFKRNYYENATWKRQYPDVMELFKESFVDEQLEMFVTAKMVIDLNNFTITSLNINDGGADDLRNFVWAPHYGNGFKCFGNNYEYIIKALKSYDIIGAIEQSIAAVMNLNFFDPPVVDAFIRDIPNTHVAKEFIRMEGNETRINYYDYTKILEERRNPKPVEPEPAPKKRAPRKKKEPEVTAEPAIAPDLFDAIFDEAMPQAVRPAQEAMDDAMDAVRFAAQAMAPADIFEDFAELNERPVPMEGN